MRSLFLPSHWQLRTAGRDRFARAILRAVTGGDAMAGAKRPSDLIVPATRRG